MKRSQKVFMILLATSIMSSVGYLYHSPAVKEARAQEMKIINDESVAESKFRDIMDLLEDEEKTTNLVEFVKIPVNHKFVDEQQYIDSSNHEACEVSGMYYSSIELDPLKVHSSIEDGKVILRFTDDALIFKYLPLELNHNSYRMVNGIKHKLEEDMTVRLGGTKEAEKYVKGFLNNKYIKDTTVGDSNKTLETLRYSLERDIIEKLNYNNIEIIYKPNNLAMMMP